MVAILATESDSLLAKESIERLARTSGPVSLHFEGDESVALPKPALDLLKKILAEMAKGNAVELVPIHGELSTQQAADILNISRPYVIELLEKEAIPFRKVGSHRRVMLKDVMDYKHARDQKRLKALDELSALDQEFGLGYQP